MSQQLQINYTVSIWREGNYYIAHAMPLDVMSAGKSLDEAREALQEAVRVFLFTAEDQQTLTEILEESGYQFIQGEWRAPDWLAVEKHVAVVGH